MERACSRIIVLNPLLPVKYKIENGNSDGEVYRKSTRRAYFPQGNFAITRHFEFPRERTSKMIFCSINLSINSLNTSRLSEVIIASMSPEFINPRL